MSNLTQDIHLALRQLLRSPGFAIAAVLTLALGIGANTAMFAVIDSVLVRPLLYTHADRLMAIGQGSMDPGHSQTSLPTWRDLRKGSKTFQDIGGYLIDLAILQGAQGGELVLAPKLTCNMLGVLDMAPRLGRGFSDADCREGAPKTVLLSDPIWRRDFGADPNIVGRQIRIGDVPHTVIGVMPAGFAFPDEARPDSMKGIWLPSQPNPEMNGRGFTLYSLLGRLRPGIGREQVRAELATMAANIRRQFPEDAKDLRFFLRPYRDVITGSVQPVFLALSAALGLVLLIACANVANLQLSRCLARHQELAVRAALGAPRWRLMRELLVEGASLSAFGALAGLALGWGILQGIHALPEGLIPRANEIQLRVDVVAILAVLAAVATILSSLIPALFAMNAEPQSVLRGAGRGVSARAMRSRVAGWLVAGEVAIATVLLIACSLLFRTLYNLEHQPLGFDADHLITFMAMPPSSAGFLSGPQGVKSVEASIETRVYEPILEKLRALPGVKDAALTSSVPFDGVDMRTSFELNGQKETEQEKQQRHAEIRVMSGDYMRVMGTPMVRGRGISDEDTEQRPYVAVVNQTFAREYLQGDPIWQRIDLGGKETGMEKPYTIVGVAADAVQKRVSAPVTPELMVSYRQIPEQSFFYQLLVASATNYALRTEGHSDEAAAIRSVFRRIAPGFAIDNLQTMQKAADASTFNQRLGFYLIGSFAGVAVVMVIIGLYGVLSQLVSQRTQEIGIRMAVGATTDAILSLVLRQGSLLIAAGLIIGAVAALTTSRLIATFLYGVRTLDTWSYLGAAALLLLVGLLAALIPAKRAASIEPIDALRTE